MERQPRLLRKPEGRRNDRPDIGSPVAGPSVYSKGSQKTRGILIGDPSAVSLVGWEVVVRLRVFLVF